MNHLLFNVFLFILVFTVTLFNRLSITDLQNNVNYNILSLNYEIKDSLKNSKDLRALLSFVEKQDKVRSQCKKVASILKEKSIKVDLDKNNKIHCHVSNSIYSEEDLDRKLN